MKYLCKYDIFDKLGNYHIKRKEMSNKYKNKNFSEIPQPKSFDVLSFWTIVRNHDKILIDIVVHNHGIN